MQKRKPKVGFMVCSSHNDDFGKKLSANGLGEIASRKLEKAEINVVRYKELIMGPVKGPVVNNFNKDAVVDTRARSMEAFKKFYHEEVDCVVMFISSFVHATNLIQGMLICNKPILLWCGDGMEGLQGIGMFSLKGAIDALANIKYKSVYGTPEDSANVKSAVSFIKASMIKSMLRESKYGMWGGTTMGMLAEGLDEVKWLRKFGIVTEHLESQTIEKEAYKISDEEAYEVYEKLNKMVTNNLPFKDSILNKDLKFYIAHKKMIEKYDLDFDGLKCIFELSDNYCSPCVAQSLLFTEGFVSGCTTVPKGALIMYIMRLITDAPIFQADIEQINKDSGKCYMAMTGAAPLNMADINGINIVKGPSVEGEAGMLNVCLAGKEGRGILTRINRIGDDYVVKIVKGEVVRSDREEIKDFGLTTMPIATFKMDGNPLKLREKINSQYFHLCYEDLTDEIVDFCKLVDIKYEIF